jgi:hypothetical protein
MRRSLLVAALLLGAAPLAAQEQQEFCTAAKPPERIRFTVTGPADLIRLPLCGGVKYLAETDRGSGMRLDFRPLTPGTAAPFVREGLMGPSVQGGLTWIVDVAATGIYELRILGLQGGLPVDVTFSPRVDKSKERAAQDSAKAAEKARKDAEKAAEKARKEAEKAEKKAREEAEKAAKSAPN